MAHLGAADTIVIIRAVETGTSALLSCGHNNFRLARVPHSLTAITWSMDHVEERESTPFLSATDEIEIHLGFDPPPKNREKGFVFGSDSRYSDVVFEQPPGRQSVPHGVSRQHFALQFCWDSGLLTLVNMSQHGTRLNAPYLPENSLILRKDEITTLPPTTLTKFYIGAAQFDISVPARPKAQQKLYDDKVKAFQAQCTKEIPDLSVMRLKTTPYQTPYMVRRQGRRHAYLVLEEVGKGNSGSVAKASADHMQDSVAIKQFFRINSRRNEMAQAELDLSHTICHKHIVSFLDIVDDELGLALIMEYLPTGSLADAEPTPEEALLVGHQVLEALVYLHDEKNVIHRDIKPENILIKSRSPDFLIKLCDFGTAFRGDVVTGFCGTLRYAAPETYTSAYTSKVDIWSLSVLILELLVDIPDPDYRAPMPTTRWFEQLDKSVPRIGRPWLQQMLAMQPEERPPARTCLRSLINAIELERKQAQSTKYTPIDIGMERTVFLRNSDLRVNATHMSSIGFNPQTAKCFMAKMRRRLPPDVFEVLRGRGSGQGTYVDFDVAIKMCEYMGLESLGLRLTQYDTRSAPPCSPDRQELLKVCSDVLSNTRALT